MQLALRQLQLPPAHHRCTHRTSREPLRPRVACSVLTQGTQADLLGTQAPEFELPEPLHGSRKVSLASIPGPTLVMFLCNHCPFVVHLKEAIVALTKEYASKGVSAVAVSSNSTVTHPQDGPDKMAEDAEKNGYPFPYLFDESQAVAKAYSAACTPEFYVLDAQHKLVWHGQFDDSRPRSDNSPPVTGKDLRFALDAVLAGEVPEPAPLPIGCNIKWTPGNEPSYFGAQQI